MAGKAQGAARPVHKQLSLLEALAPKRPRATPAPAAPTAASAAPGAAKAAPATTGGGGGGGGIGDAKRDRNAFLKAVPTANAGNARHKREREVVPNAGAGAGSGTAGAATRSHSGDSATAGTGAAHRDRKRLRVEPDAPGAGAAAAAALSVGDVRHDQRERRFILSLNGHGHGGGAGAEAFLEYELAPSAGPNGRAALDFVHTSVPKAFQGQGIATIVCKAAFDYALDQQLFVVPSCTYISQTFLSRAGTRAQYASILLPDDGADTAAAAAAPASGATAGKRKAAPKPTATAASPATPNSPTTPPATVVTAAHRQFGTATASGSAAGAAPTLKRTGSGSGSSNSSTGSSHGGGRSDSGNGSGSSSKLLTVGTGPPSSGVPDGHVPMPHHPLFAKRWAKLLGLISSVKDSESLVTAVYELNSKKKNIDRSTKGLTFYLQTCMPSAMKHQFYGFTLPFMCGLLRDLPQTFPSAVLPLLRAGKTNTLELTAKQCASILVCGFFLLHAEHSAPSGGSEHERQYQSANFDGVYASLPQYPSQQSKLRCILHYFARIAARSDAELTAQRMSVHRRVVPLTVAAFEHELEADSGALQALDTREVGTIEDDGAVTLQIDFANKHIGGGVLGHGCIQEEIRFVINPECLVALLFAETMQPAESIVLIGCERFSNYTGYSKTFRWSGDHVDPTPRQLLPNGAHRLCTVIVAIDAIRFAAHRAREQFRQTAMLREIYKAYVGFSVPAALLPVPTAAMNTATAAATATGASGTAEVPYSTVSTGNWGCGAFNGDVPLKSMLQWLAASKAGRRTRYFTFGDRGTSGLLHTALCCTSGHVRIRELWAALTTYSRAIATNANPIPAPVTAATAPPSADRKPSLPRPASSSTTAAADGKAGATTASPAAIAKKPSDAAPAAAAAAAVDRKASDADAADGGAPFDVEADAAEAAYADLEDIPDSPGSPESRIARVGVVTEPPTAPATSASASAATAAAPTHRPFPTVFEYLRYRFGARSTLRVTDGGSIEFGSASGHSSGIAELLVNGEPRTGAGSGAVTQAP